VAHPPARHGCRTQARGRRLHGKTARRHDDWLSHTAPGGHAVGWVTGSPHPEILPPEIERAQNRGRAVAARRTDIEGHFANRFIARCETARLAHLPRGQRRAGRAALVSAANADKTGTPRVHWHGRVIPARPVGTRGIPGSAPMTTTPSWSGRPRRTAVRCADIKVSSRRLLHCSPAYCPGWRPARPYVYASPSVVRTSSFACYACDLPSHFDHP
jgi:hypothetical protein